MRGKVSFSGDRVVVIESLEFYSQARRITDSSPPLTLAPSLYDAAAGFLFNHFACSYNVCIFCFF